MDSRDIFQFATRAVRAHRLRSALTVLGIAIGIASVILLTSIGEGTRRYILAEFTQFGTNLITINPGRTDTGGLPGAVLGTVRGLTLDDAEALRRLPGIESVAPMVWGAARVETRERERSVRIFAVTVEALEAWQLRVRPGNFLPAGDPRQAPPVAVLGAKLKQELFGEANALGQHVRIGGERYRVIGVLAPKGQFLSIDLDDTAYIPLARGMSLFHREHLMEIDVLGAIGGELPLLAEQVRRTLIERHDGREDFTLTTQTEMLGTLDRVLGIISLAVGGIAGISLVVGAVGILTMMWISVHERTGEIGLSMALGATRRQILLLYLGEASLLSTSGGLLGLASGLGAALLLRLLVPGLPVHTPLEMVGLALLVSLVVGLASGILPARRAAALDPIQALGAE